MFLKACSSAFISVSTLLSSVVFAGDVGLPDEVICPDDSDVLVLADSNLATSEDGGEATFTVVLTCPPSDDVVITFVSDNTAEGRINAANRFRVTRTPANWNRTFVLTVQGVDDNVDDGDQTYNIFTSVESNDPDYANINPVDVAIVNQDDDSAGVTVINDEPLFVTEAGGTAMFSVVLDSEPTAAVMIDIVSNRLGEATVSPGSLLFTAADWDMPQQVTITGVDDDEVDGQQTFFIGVRPVVSDDPVYDGIDPANVMVTNIDDDREGDIVIDPTNLLTTNEAGGSAVFTVVLTSEPATPVTLGFSSDNLAEGTVNPESIVFTANDWDSPQAVFVTGVRDGVVDGDQMYNIIIGMAESIDPVFDGIDPDDLNAVNEDIDLFVDNFDELSMLDDNDNTKASQ